MDGMTQRTVDDHAQTSGPELLFRPATSADVPALVDLVNFAYRGDGGRQGWTTESDLLAGPRCDPEGLAEVMAKPYTMVQVAERAGELIGCFELERVNADDAYFGMFAISPAAQGAQVGTRVLREAERITVEWGCRRMVLKTLVQREDLGDWYERRGYRRNGELTPFPYGEERFGVPTRPDLQFEELEKVFPVTRTPASLAEVRDRIDAIDAELIGFLARRQDLVRAAAGFKRDEQGVRDPERVERVVAGARSKAEAVGLAPEVAEAVWRSMISAFIELELAEHRSTAG
ncbi:GNAT family N-acetyltransferase [Rhizohabitans arisaemae]|uniref:GNAT family N-acetyltransferase n=1 Tax=Rhizohabitans arisaemae TaxID=2720610 RepID=UPI0031FF2088